MKMPPNHRGGAAATAQESSHGDSEDSQPPPEDDHGSLSRAFLAVFAPWLLNRKLFPQPLIFLGVWFTFVVALLLLCTLFFMRTDLRVR